jgi:hypothetical protein
MKPFFSSLELAKNVFSFQETKGYFSSFLILFLHKEAKVQQKDCIFCVTKQKGFFPAKFGIAMGSQTFAFDTDDSN